ncbi:MAG: ABC transporter substrate-binding protein [Pseudomonadota bacterium]
MTDKTLIQRMLRDPRTSRREFMVGATALGLTASAASGLWTTTQAATPKKGGHLKAGLLGGNTSDSLDGATYIDTVMICVARACRDSLVEVGQDNTAQPGLAESWEASADAKTWRFKIRQGVEFSNGKSLTTEDVINSVNTHRGEDSKSGAKGVFSGIEDIKADGDVVEFTLSGGNADFPFLLTDYHMNVVPTVDGKADVLSVHGTGLYTLKDFEPGIRITMERSPNAWQQGEFGFFDSAEVIVISDNTARQNAVLTQSVDVINRPDLRTMDTITRAPFLGVQDVPSNLMYTMPMRVDTPYFTDNNVRMAIKHGINRQELLDKVLFGYGTIGNDHPIGPGFRYHAADITQNQYDPDKAKFYMKQAGLDSHTVPLSTSETAFVGADDAAQLVAASLAPIGINVEVTREPQDGYWSNVWNNKPWCNCYWGSRPVEDMILSIQYLSDAPWNDTVSKDPKVDDLIKTARAELDPTKRAGQYREIQEIVSQSFGNVVWAFGSDVAVLNKKIAYGAIGGGWEMDGGHFIKRWWMA